MDKEKENIKLSISFIELELLITGLEVADSEFDIQPEDHPEFHPLLENLKIVRDLHV